MWIDGYPLRQSQGPKCPSLSPRGPRSDPPHHWNYPSLRSTHPSSAAAHPELGHSGTILGTRSQDPPHPLGQVGHPAEGSSSQPLPVHDVCISFVVKKKKNGTSFPFKQLQSAVLSSLETRNRKRAPSYSALEPMSISLSLEEQPGVMYHFGFLCFFSCHDVSVNILPGIASELEGFLSSVRGMLGEN